MPREPVSPDPLVALGAALEGLRAGAREGADDVLSHYPELGDRETQSELEAYLDQAADLLREVEASCSELADRVRLLDVSGDRAPRVSGGAGAEGADAGRPVRWGR